MDQENVEDDFVGDTNFFTFKNDIEIFYKKEDGRDMPAASRCILSVNKNNKIPVINQDLQK